MTERFIRAMQSNIYLLVDKQLFLITWTKGLYMYVQLEFLDYQTYYHSDI